MATSYIRMVQVYDDPVWGRQVMPWISSPLIRVYRNRLRKATFEYVGNGATCDIKSYGARWVVTYDTGRWSTKLSPWMLPRVPLP